jgi:hypothetical protein
LLFSAKNSERLQESTGRMRTFFNDNEQANLADAAYTLQTGRAYFNNRKFIGIVRNPIDRFLSICNFKNMSPAEFIDRILKNSSKNFESLSTTRFTQEDSFKSPLPIDLTLILMSEKELIKNWFAEHGVYINLDVHLNTSVKRYNVNDITEDQLEIIKDYFSLDIKLYEELKAANGILNFKNHTHVSFP